MAAERPNIIQAKNDVVQITLPYTEGTIDTYSTAAISAGGTSLTVKDNAALANNDYLILGVLGDQQTEIVKIGAAVSAGTALTIGATTFSHPIGTKVTLVRYNQVALYGSSSASDAAPTAIGSAVTIDVKRGYNEIKASTTYNYYYARFYNSQTTTYSSYSDSTAATGLSAQSRGELKKEFISIYSERIDELISDDWLNRTINRWQRELQKRRKQWSVLRATSNTDTTQDKQGYTLPTDIQDKESRDPIVSMKFYDKNILKPIDQDVFLRFTRDHIGTTLAADVAVIDVTISLTDASDFPSSGTIHIAGDSISYTGKSSNTLTGVTGITDTHTSGDEVWQTYTAGQPQYYSIDNGKYKLFPIPDSASAEKNVYLEYWKKFVDLSDDADETLFRFPENFYLYAHWQSAIRRRLPDDIQTSRKDTWQEDLENMVAEDPDFRDVAITPLGADYYNNPY